MSVAVAILGATFALIVAVAWIPARRSAPSVDVALALVAATAVVAVAGRRAAVIGAAAGSACGFTFFDTEPYEHFSITHGSDVATAVLLVVVGLITGELALRVIRQRRLDGGAGGDLGRVREAAARLAHGEELVMMIGAVADQITTVLGAADCSFSTEEADAGLRFIDRDGSLRTPEPVGAGPRPVPAAGVAELVALPVLSQGVVVGRLVVLPRLGSALTPERSLVAVTLADQVGAALAAQAPPITPITDPGGPVVPPPGPLLRVVR